MSGFIANGSNEPFTITNDWFPNINADHLRAAHRFEGSITNERLETAIINAILSINKELTAVKETNGQHETMADIPAPQINGESSLLALYRRAVYSTVGAELTERYRNYDSSGQGLDNAEQLTPTIDELRRDARWAISDLLGKPRSTVELI